MHLDQFFAIAYFQQGVSNFIIGNFKEALANFNDASRSLRKNSVIDYSQLGLLFKLYKREILVNQGLCSIFLQQNRQGMQILSDTAKEKIIDDYKVITEAIQYEAEGYTVFSMPVGVVYRPNESKVRNLNPKVYLREARLVAISDHSTGFTGSKTKVVSFKMAHCAERHTDISPVLYSKQPEKLLWGP